MFISSLTFIVGTLSEQKDIIQVLVYSAQFYIPIILSCVILS